MKQLIILISALFSISCTHSQKYLRPVFDRTDNYMLHLDSVETTKDSTFLYFTLETEAGTWANIAPKTHVRDCNTNKCYPIKNVKGISFEPQQYQYTRAGRFFIRMSFEDICPKKFDFIEDESDSLAFNIWGVNLLDVNDDKSSCLNIEQAHSLSSRADFYASIDDFQKALELELESMNIIKAYFGRKSIGYAVSAMKVALFSCKVGDFDNAIFYGKQELELCRLYYGEQHETYAYSLTSLASYYSIIGDYMQAMTLDEAALQIRRASFGEQSLEYATSLYRLANDYAGIGDFLRAIENVEKSIAIQRSANEKDELQYLVTLNSSASFYASVNQYERAINIEEEVMLLAKEIYGTQHSEYATFLGNLAGYESHVGNHKVAIQLATEATKIKQGLGSNHPEYRNSINTLAQIIFNSGDVKTAIEKQKECISLFNDTDRISDRIHYITALNNIAFYYASINDFATAVSYSMEAIVIVKDYLAESTGIMSENQKYVFWQQFNTMFDDAVPYYIAKLKDDSYFSYLYDLTLYSKGFTMRHQSFDYTYKDVLKQLKEGELAIEFISPTMTLNQRTELLNYALVMSLHQKPQLVELYNSAEFYNQIQETNNRDSLLGELLWKPLLPYIKNSKRVFFSPTFVLNSIGIEYLPLEEYNHLSECAELYRVSSTIEIINQHSRKAYNNAVLIGDLNYDNIQTNQILENVGHLRGSYEPLPQTGFEISEINKILHSKDINCYILSGEAGTEASFRNLSSKHLDILHIATHGGYLDSEKAKYEKENNNYSFISLEAGYGPIYREQVLTRSFLLMSGGNRLIQRDSLTSRDNDGFLTAFEISQMDLSGTDIVVLSTCESALGDWGIDGGLMGLQRGFKEAGVKTILMSLDKVDDEATRILMVEFYKNLMSGKSKHQSLRDAQKYLREVDNGKYDDPKYWAAFIMLDGLD